MGLKFHRVIPNFMVQGVVARDGTGAGGPVILFICEKKERSKHMTRV